MLQKRKSPALIVLSMLNLPFPLDNRNTQCYLGERAKGCTAVLRRRALQSNALMLQGRRILSKLFEKDPL